MKLFFIKDHPEIGIIGLLSNCKCRSSAVQRSRLI